MAFSIPRFRYKPAQLSFLRNLIAGKRAAESPIGLTSMRISSVTAISSASFPSREIAVQADLESLAASRDMPEFNDSGRALIPERLLVQSRPTSPLPDYEKHGFHGSPNRATQSTCAKEHIVRIVFAGHAQPPTVSQQIILV